MKTYEVTITNVHNEWLYEVEAINKHGAKPVAQRLAMRDGWNGIAHFIGVRKI